MRSPPSRPFRGPCFRNFDATSLPEWTQAPLATRADAAEAIVSRAKPTLISSFRGWRSHLIVNDTMDRALFRPWDYGRACQGCARRTGVAVRIDRSL